MSCDVEKMGRAGLELIHFIKYQQSITVYSLQFDLRLHSSQFNMTK